MKFRAFSLIPAVIIALCSCGGNSAQELASPRAGSITALYGTDISNVTVEEFLHQNYVLAFHSIPPEGIYLRLALSPNLVCRDDQWQGDGHVIHVVGNGELGAEIGVRPVDGYQGEKVALALYTKTGVRTASTPPSGAANAVADLTIVAAGEGRMRLDWTEMNVGDYNVNGAVEVADLTPLGVNFNESYDPEIDGTFNNPLFWVDGNRNGFIEVGDITPIGQHFGTFIRGYNVLRNGVVVKIDPGDDVSVSRSEAEIRPFLPPRYSFEFDNAPGDEWTVAPLDAKGAVGTESEPVTLPLAADLQLDLQITGLDLLNLDGAGGTGPLGASGRSLMKVVDPYEIMRRIAPGDVPNLMELGSAVDPETPQARFYDLPRDQALALLVMYAPVNDLTTGDPKGGSSARGASQTIAIEHETTIIPFRLPETGASLLSVDISLPENPAGGYFTDVMTEFNTGVDPPVADHVRLDNHDMVVSRDNDGDDSSGQEFADEARLADPDRFALSDRRLERLVDVDDYGNPQDVVVYGQVSEFDEQAGALNLYNVYIILPTGDVVQSGSWDVQFSEMSDFYGTSGDMIPADLAENDIVRLDVDYLVNSELDPSTKNWLRTLYFDSGDHDPVAIIDAEPTSGSSPLLVVFTADRSYDIFGAIVKYEFDFGEGAGWEDFGLTTTAPHVYNAESTYTARLRVTDDDGNTDTDQAIIEVGEAGGDGVINISITINFNVWTTTDALTRVAIYDHQPTGLADIDWIGREPEDPNPYGRKDTDIPEDGVPQVLTWEGIVDGQYWYAVTRLVTRWEGDQDDFGVFGPFTVNADVHDFANVGEQYGEPPGPA
jgi:PKD repeat protein